MYVDPIFIDFFLKIPKESSDAIKVLWNIIENYAGVEWVFNENITYQDFEKWEVSSKFYSKINSKGSNNVILYKDFLTEISENPTATHIILANKVEDWHDKISQNAIIITPDNFENIINNIVKNLSFRFLVDENKDFIQFDGLKSEKVSEITLTDKYILAQFLKTGDTRKLDRNFIYLFKKLVHQDSVKLNILTKSADADAGKTEILENKLRLLVSYCKEKISENLSFKFINTELNYQYDFHDRNIFSKYYIVKSGKGFEISNRININAEIECFSIFDKWGYDLIRHRTRMCKSYLKEIKDMANVFTIYNP